LICWKKPPRPPTIGSSLGDCNKEFESDGLRYYSKECESAYRESEANRIKMK
jgi:hypothetical protein